MTPAQLFTGPSNLHHSELCVYFRGSLAGENTSLSRYPAFWTSDQREAELFIASGTSHLQLLDKLWQSRQFDKLDSLFQEIENETLKKRREEELNAETPAEINKRTDGSLAC